MKVLVCILAIFAATAGCIDTAKPGTGGDEGRDGASVVLVGVENGYAGSCPGALKDVADMNVLLETYAGKVVTLTDRAATASAVKAALAVAVKSDFAIFYFSGHGGSADTGGPEEADGVDECIFCFDGYVVDDDIWKIVSRARGRVLLVFDCCHSETMFKTAWFSFKAAAGRRSPGQAGGPPGGLLCWSGCPDDSYSYGSSTGGEFTRAILKYADKDKTYSQVWEKISSDEALRRHQSVRSTRIGGFDADGTMIFK